MGWSAVMVAMALTPAMRSADTGRGRIADSTGFLCLKGLPRSHRASQVKSWICSSAAATADRHSHLVPADWRLERRLDRKSSSLNEVRCHVNAALRQQRADVVLQGLRLARNLRYQTMYSLGPRADFFEKPAMRGVLSKLSSILEPTAPNMDLEFSSEQIARVRDEISEEYAMGEKHLSLLSQLFAHHFTQGDYICRSTVEAKAGKHSFTLSQSLPRSALKGRADSLQLAAQQLSDLRVDVSEHCPGFIWTEAQLVDHSLEFEALRRNAWGLVRVVAHAKSSRDFGKVISDSFLRIANSDEQLLLQQQQQQQQHDMAAAAASSSSSSSRSPLAPREPAGMYHIKLVVEGADDAQALQRSLGNFFWQDKDLREHGVPVGIATRHLELLERSPAVPRCSTFNWMGTAVSVRVLTLDEYHADSACAAAAGSGWATTAAASAPRLRGGPVGAGEVAAAAAAAAVPAAAEPAKEQRLVDFSLELLEWIVGPTAPRSEPPSCDKIHVAIYD